MKKILFFYFLFSSVVTFSQSADDTQPATVSFKTYGYISGKRLDSIDATYAQITLYNSSLAFNYGQVWNKRKELIVKDNNGADMLFADTYNVPFALNFLYFNGWQLDHAYNNDSYNSVVFILKKRTSQ